MDDKTRFPSELRFDLASRDWVVIATGRAKRPEVFKREKGKQARVGKKGCPFCDISTQKTPALVFVNGKRVKMETNDRIPRNWTTAIIPNKYPAFLPDSVLNKRTEGKLYQAMEAVGFHEVVITRDHDKSLALLKEKEVEEVINAYRTRYLELMNQPFVNYISIFHNHGPESGASIYHPHSQLITTPLIDPDLNKALSNSKRYFKREGRCVYCEMSKWERRFKKRIVFENKNFLVLCPFASKMAFQMIITPKKHLSNFEKITRAQTMDLAQALKVCLFKLYRGLNNPSYNFYLRTAPCDGKEYSFYHWHWTILPKTSVHAGFELGAGMEISTIEPERAAEYLRKQ
jgi:UDPglucose--hexose-1-phosphate uridylyltransferase